MIEGETKRAFECTIFQQVVRQPVTSGCCNTLPDVSKDCLDMWLTHSPVCPLCIKATLSSLPKSRLKGFNDLLALFLSENRTQALSASQGKEADDDFDTPPF